MGLADAGWLDWCPPQGLDQEHSNGQGAGMVGGFPAPIEQMALGEESIAIAGVLLEFSSDASSTLCRLGSVPSCVGPPGGLPYCPAGAVLPGVPFGSDWVPGKGAGRHAQYCS